MKQVKLFYNVDETRINNWIYEMYSKAKEQTNGNIEFVVHDIKMTSASDGEGGMAPVVMVIYSHTI